MNPLHTIGKQMRDEQRNYFRQIREAKTFYKENGKGPAATAKYNEARATLKKSKALEKQFDELLEKTEA